MQATATKAHASAIPRSKTGEAITEKGCAQCALHYSWLSLMVNAGLAVLKIVVGLLAGSRALVASALYSINDILSGLIVIISTRVARRAPNQQFAYGYGNAEYVAIGVVSVIVIGGVIFLLAYSVVDIIRGGHGPPHPIAIPVALVALGANYYLAKRGYCIAKRTQSPMVETAAEHNHADAEGSLLALIGVGGAALGFHLVDPIIAVIETLHIVWLAGKLFGHSIRGLMDSALPPSQVLAAARAASEVAGVHKVVTMRTRQSGAFAWVDAEIEIDSGSSIERADDICRAVSREIERTLPHDVRSQVKFRVRSPDEQPEPPPERGVARATT